MNDPLRTKTCTICLEEPSCQDSCSTETVKRLDRFTEWNQLLSVEKNE